jgi:hypothetical protein
VPAPAHPAATLPAALPITCGGVPDVTRDATKAAP